MRYNKLFTILSLLTTSLVKSNASRSDFFGKDDYRPELFKILDDHIGTFKIDFDNETWETMKQKSVLEPWDAAKNGEKYGTTNATLEFFVEGTDYRVELQPGDFNFYLAGKGSRNFAKPGYNIKLENGSIYDVKLLRLRSNIRDATSIREKLSSDLLYKMGVKTTSTNYAKIIVNGEDIGLFVLSNKIKKDLIKKYFNEKSTDNLYECKNDYARFEDNSILTHCNNIKEELADKKDDLQALVDAVNNAKTIDDIKDIIDIDALLTTFAFEFVTLSWDHFFILGHNYFWYKNPESGKWMMIINDFDETFCQDIWPNYFTDDSRYITKPYIPKLEYINLPNLSVRDMDSGHKLVKLLIYDDDTRWREILGEVVKNAFNPKILNPRIDEIADLIRDEVKVTREILKETGRARGVFNTAGNDPKWQIKQFEDTINYTNWASNNGASRSYGLKFFIEERFKYICHTYGINPETLELIQPRPVVSFWSIVNKYPFSCDGNCYVDGNVKFMYPDLNKENYMKESYNADAEKNKDPEYEYPPTYHEQNNLDSESVTTNVTDVTEAATTTIASEPTTVELTTESTCWSEKLGYPCCKSSCFVFTTDKNGDWGYEDSHWCGIPSTCAKDECWSKKYGYDCCKGCKAYEVDNFGKWGYEKGYWCGINEENCQ